MRCLLHIAAADAAVAVSRCPAHRSLLVWRLLPGIAAGHVDHITFRSRHQSQHPHHYQQMTLNPFNDHDFRPLIDSDNIFFKHRFNVHQVAELMKKNTQK